MWFGVKRAKCRLRHRPGPWYSVHDSPITALGLIFQLLYIPIYSLTPLSLEVNL